MTQAEIDFLSTHPLRAGTLVALREDSMELIKKVSSEANPNAVKDIYYLMNVKSKFQKNSEQIVNAYITDDKTRFYNEIASDYFNKRLTKAALIKLIDEQKKNFPVKSKASYSVN